MMFINSQLLLLPALVLSAAASPITAGNAPTLRLPLTKRTSGPGNIANNRFVSEHFPRDVPSVPLANNGFGYLATIGVGNPSQGFDVLVDTGSSTILVGANIIHPYMPTRTSQDTRQNFTLAYAIGEANVTLYADEVRLGDLKVPNQVIGVAYESTHLNNDGFLGLGPKSLAIQDKNGALIPTLLDMLSSQGTIPTNSFALSFYPFGGNVHGELTFGGVDLTHLVGDITYTPRTTSGDSKVYWGIKQNILYGSSTILMNGIGVVDSGSTLIYLATAAFRKYVDKIGARPYPQSTLYYITPEQYKNIESLYFEIEGTKFELVPDAQVWPHLSNATQYQLAVGDIGTFTQKDLDFVLGYMFLERFYTVFDADQDCVGFATTMYTNAAINNPS